MSYVPDVDTIQLPVTAIDTRNNDRQHFDQAAIERLAESIKEVGLISPIVVQPKPTGRGYWLVAGERRWRAHLVLGAKTITAVVTGDDEQRSQDRMLAENTGRVDLNPIEEARAYQRRIDELGYTVERVASVAGRSPAHVRWRLGLLSLDPMIVEAVRAGQVKHTVAECLVGLDTNRQRAALAAQQRSPMTWDEFGRLCDRMRDEQATQSMFDADVFELQAEEYVQQARRANKALSVRQMAVLFDQLLLQVDVEHPAPSPELAAMLARAREVVDYRLEQAQKRKGR